jgi:hypothetical protein
VLKAEIRLARARVRSYARTSGDRLSTACSISDSVTKEKLRNVVRPPDVSKSLKMAGAALLIPPDPITDVAGVALIGAAYAMRSRRPLSIESMLVETRKTMRDLQSIL